MNLYVVIEGKVEKSVYRSWIPLVNPQLSYVEDLSEIGNDNFYLISGGGYPGYFDVIDNAILDVNEIGIFDRLVISADSEEMTLEEKYQELFDYVSEKKCSSEIRIIIQHFCFETWGLGNRKAVSPHTSSQKLQEYKQFFNVRVNDPELLPPYIKEGLNRSQFAEKYLRLALNDKRKNLTYTKKTPNVLLHPKYFAQVKNRVEETQHIHSFEAFLEAFV